MSEAQQMGPLQSEMPQRFGGCGSVESEKRGPGGRCCIVSREAARSGTGRGVREAHSGPGQLSARCCVKVK